MKIRQRTIQFKNSDNFLMVSDMDIKPGRYVIRGENGSGKSTFLKELVSGNEDFVKFDDSLKDIVLVGQSINLFFKLSVLQNIEILLPDSKIIEAKQILTENDINLQTKVSKLSGGEKAFFVFVHKPTTTQ